MQSKLSSSPPHNNKKSGGTMQGEVVSKLVPGVIITAQSLGQGRLILLVHEDRAMRPQYKFAIRLIENYRKVGAIHGLHWDLAEGFLRACHKDSNGEPEIWWKLICGRVREQGGNVAP